MKKLLFLVSILSMSSLSAQFLDTWWGGSITGPNSNTSGGNCIAHTISGEVYGVISAGTYQSAASPGTNLDPMVGGTTNEQLSTGPFDMYINRVNYNGSYVWSKNISGSLTEAPLGLVANSTACYVTGYFAGAVTFGPGVTLTSVLAAPGVYSRDIFVASYDVVYGNLIWARRYGANKSDTATSIAFDPLGNIVVVGNFQGSVSFDPSGLILPVVSSVGGGNDAFIASFDPAGNCLMAQTFGGPGNEHPHSVFVDASGNIAIGGYFGSNTCDFAPGAPSCTPFSGCTGIVFQGMFDAFVARFSAVGTLLFARTFGTPYKDEITGVATDAASNIYFTGDYQRGSITLPLVVGGSVYLDNTLAVSPNFADIILGAYNTAGAVLWVRDFGNTLDDVASCISLDSYDRVWMAGYYEAPGGGATVDFNQPIGSLGISKYISTGRDMFIASYSIANGTYVGSDRIFGNGAERIRDIDIYSPDYFIWATGQASEDAGTTLFDVDPDPAINEFVPINSHSHSDAVMMEYRFFVMPNRLAAPTHSLAYPNPNSGTFYLDNLMTSDVIEIYSLDGKLCATRTATGDGKMQIQLNELENGVYVLNTIRNGEIILNDRVVISR